MTEHHRLIILGAGPAGLAAALYAARGGIPPLVLDKDAPGGKLLKTYEICNWPGLLREGGPELAAKMLDHAMSCGATLAHGQAVSILPGREFTLSLADGKKLKANAVIVATGTRERPLGIPGEKENLGRGLSYCAVCDGALYRGKKVAVIGGGNSALEEAIYLTRFAAQVTIVTRREALRAEEGLVKEARQDPKITFLPNYVPRSILDDGARVTGLRLKSPLTGAETVLEADAVFPYIGSDPATDFLTGLGVLDENGYLVTDEAMKTSVPGLFGAGDVRRKPLRQVVTAAGDGAAATQSALQYLKSQPL